MGLSTTSSTEWGAIRRGKTIQDIEKLCRRFEHLHAATCRRLPLQSLSPQPERDLDGSFPTLVIDDNRVDRCGDNGIQVWRSIRGDDGTRISGNHVSDIKNVSGGSGAIWQRHLDFSRRRGVGHEQHDPPLRLQRGAEQRRRRRDRQREQLRRPRARPRYSPNSTSKAASFPTIRSTAPSAASRWSISPTVHGRAAVCSGNIIRNLKPTPSHSGHEFGYECGVKVEADATVSGNVIEGAPWVGILVGWGPSLRDVAVQRQCRARRADWNRRLDRRRRGRGGDRRQYDFRGEPGRGAGDESRSTGHSGSGARRLDADAIDGQRQSSAVRAFCGGSEFA